MSGRAASLNRETSETRVSVELEYRRPRAVRDRHGQRHVRPHARPALKARADGPDYLRRWGHRRRSASHGGGRRDSPRQGASGSRRRCRRYHANGARIRSAGRGSRAKRRGLRRPGLRRDRPAVDRQRSGRTVSGPAQALFGHAGSREGRFNLHVRLLSGTNNHHCAEAAFKSLARAIRAGADRRRQAVRGDAQYEGRGRVGRVLPGQLVDHSDSSWTSSNRYSSMIGLARSLSHMRRTFSPASSRLSSSRRT